MFLNTFLYLLNSSCSNLNQIIILEFLPNSMSDQSTKESLVDQIANTATNKGVIIGVTIGAVAFVILVVIILICCCCRKAERSCLKRSIGRMDKKFNKRKHELESQQQKRRDELNQRHNEIRNKYGLGSNPTAQNPKENIYTVENEQINLSLHDG
ncbi:pituitary tumor-transforming protein 1 -interacting -like [Brachionus plicatilis]|uniref:Pituitary tumor-transforming protein 1-interacting-like n=1 Tax=Brachionus plicatilis TaxID=10195 RepID=A0A3M7SEE7_BRAPC|nr:pituitary tumor-transforming protein 1 -interacting -like [Brachionus plicatilis]